MKKSILVIIVSFLSVTLSYSAAPTNSVVDGSYGIYTDTVIYSSTGFDTVGATDSTTLFSKGLNYPGEGWQWILVRSAITGGGSDSVALQVVCDALDGSDNLLYRTVVDTFTAAAGEAVLLPIGGTIFGIKYRVRLIGITGNGGVVILNRLYLMKRRVEVKSIPAGR